MAEQWPTREWIRDHTDMYMRDVVVQADVLLAMVAKLEAAERVAKRLDFEHSGCPYDDCETCAAMDAWESASAQSKSE